MTKHITVRRELLRSIQDAVIRLKPFVSGLGNSVLREIEVGVASALEQPPQKPELRVGQVWRTRGGGVVEIVDETKNPSHPFWCESVRDSWSVTKDGNYISKAVPAPYDLIELISDVQEGGDA